MKVRYRRNVCIVIKKRGSDLVLLCHRKDYPKNLGWQFPQGGIHKNADVLSEMKRELREEIGTDAVAVIAVSKKKYAYEFPADSENPRPGFGGQIQQWILAELRTDDSTLNFNHKPSEFDAFRWATPNEALKEIVDFKKQTYGEALKDLGLLAINSMLTI